MALYKYLFDASLKISLEKELKAFSFARLGSIGTRCELAFGQMLLLYSVT